jgi:hypothetical protein
MIEVEEGIFYDPSKPFNEQSPEFKEYGSNWYYEELAKIINSTGYPDFNEDGSWSFHIENDLLEADVQRIQMIPFSTADRRIKESIVNIKVK